MGCLTTVHVNALHKWNWALNVQCIRPLWFYTPGIKQLAEWGDHSLILLDPLLVTLGVLTESGQTFSFRCPPAWTRLVWLSQMPWWRASMRPWTIAHCAMCCSKTKVNKTLFWWVDDLLWALCCCDIWLCYCNAMFSLLDWGGCCIVGPKVSIQPWGRVSH